MRIVLKILAAPAMCLLALSVAICSFVLMVAGFICWFLTGLLCVSGVVLLVTQHTAGGLAFLAIAFLVSPSGLPALAAWLVGKMNNAKYSLQEFILY